MYPHLLYHDLSPTQPTLLTPLHPHIFFTLFPAILLPYHLLKPCTYIPHYPQPHPLSQSFPHYLPQPLPYSIHAPILSTPLSLLTPACLHHQENYLPFGNVWGSPSKGLGNSMGDTSFFYNLKVFTIVQFSDFGFFDDLKLVVSTSWVIVVSLWDGSLYMDFCAINHGGNKQSSWWLSSLALLYKVMT